LSPDVRQSEQDVFALGITIERKIDASTHKLSMNISEMVVVIDQAALRKHGDR